MFISLIFIGLFSGFLAGLLGIGGGILFLPAATIYFIDYLHYSPLFIKVIIATSSTMIVANSLSSLIRHTRNGYVYWKIAPLFLLTTSLGGRFGGLFSTLSDPIILKKGMGILFWVTAIIFALKQNQKERDQLQPLTLLRGFVIAIASFLIAVIAAALGIGGGSFTIPLLYYVGKLPVKMVVGTSSFFTLSVSLNAVIYYLMQPDLAVATEHWAVGYVAFKIAIPVMISGAIGAQIGASLLKKISSTVVKYLFIAILIIGGIKLIF